MTFSNQPRHFTYNLLVSGIHELNLYTASPESYTQCFACLDRIFAQNAPGEPLLLLTNLYQFDVQRAADVWRLSRKLLVKSPQKRPLYNAVAHRSPGTISALITAMSQIASVFGGECIFVVPRNRKRRSSGCWKGKMEHVLMSSSPVFYLIDFGGFIFYHFCCILYLCFLPPPV